MEFHGYQEDRVEPQLDLDHLRQLWPFVRPYRRQFGWALALLLVSFGVELAGPWLVRQMIDGPITDAIAGGPLDSAAVLRIGGAYIGLLVMGSFLGFRYAMVTARNGQQVVHDLRLRLYRHLFRLSPRFFDRNPAGKLVTRVTSDVENLNDLIATGVLQTLFDLLKIVGIVAVMFALDLRLALFGVVTVPVLIGLSLLFRRFAREAYAAVRGRLAKQNAFTAEMIGGVRTTRAFGREDTVDAHFDALNTATRRGWQQTIFWFALFFALIELLLRWSQAGTLLIGGEGILTGGLSAGLFIQFWLYFTKLGEPIRELGEKYNVLQSAFSSSERIFGILGQPIEPPEASSAQPSPGGRPAALRFEKVSFGYDEDAPVLQDVSLDIPAGSTCAFIGPTGAGKSTILSLAARLHDPDEGSIHLDDVDLRALQVTSLRRRIAIVPQDAFLFTGTILENLRLFDPAISRERVAAAISTVGAEDLLERSGRDSDARGLDARVEERGGTFSQGERQLLAMARALCHDPDLLILDEATANIDSETEARLQRALDALRAERTVLVVAHRLSTVENADRVYVVENGRVQLRPART